VLDVGCGIGSDGLALLEEGYSVEFADFDNPSTRYLRWRLSRRGLSAPVYDLDAVELPSGFDLAYAFDVLEHVSDPFALLASMEASASLVCVNLVLDSDSTVLHRSLPVRRIAWRARRRGLRVDRWLHGRRVRLLIYGAGGRRDGRPR
jgi:cyclopropane fatty-acyl-phospholipid synthase-like methyltransferase